MQVPGLAGLHWSGAGSQALSWLARAAGWQQLPLTSAAPGRALAAAPAHGAPTATPVRLGRAQHSHRASSALLCPPNSPLLF